MDTLGSLIDKLFTTDMKLFMSQEDFYIIRGMTFEQFKEKYFSSEENCKKLYDLFNKGIDLNLQRNQLIDEIDSLLVQFGKDVRFRKDLHKYKQLKHKTYDHRKG